MMNRPAEVKAPPFWAMYIGVPKLEEAVAHIKRLGGKTHTDVIDDPERRPHADDDGPAGRGVLHHRAGQPGAASGSCAGNRRRLVARADDDGHARGDEVLPGGVRLAAERGDGHGPDGHYQMFNRGRTA